MAATTRAGRIFHGLGVAGLGMVSFLAMLLPIETGRAETTVTDPNKASVAVALRDGWVRRAKLPIVLSADDQTKYRRVFEALKADDFAAATQILATVENKVLEGHVLGQKYLDPRYRPSYSELTSWLDANRDLPGADRIYVMARAKAPRKHGAITEPGAVGLPAAVQPLNQWRPPFEGRSSAQIARIKSYDTLMQNAINAQRPEEAEKRFGELDGLNLLTGNERDERLGRIVFAYFNRAKDDAAITLAEAAKPTVKAPLPRTAFNGGLAAWRRGEYERAATLFETVAAGTDMDPLLSAAGDYWAARANLAAGRMNRVSVHLRRASLQKATFYGLLAQRQLGLETQLSMAMPDAAQDEVDSVLVMPGVRRALALSEVGEIAAADEEIRLTFLRAGRAWLQPLLAIAAYKNLPYSMTFMTRMSGAEQTYSEGVRFPLPVWQPREGFTLDPALVYAISRQESEFRARAGSPVGAQGLMQLMPATAAMMENDKSLRGSGVYRLQDPEFNLSLGQRYVDHLRSSDWFADDNLLPILAAYNWGPGNVSRWMTRVGPVNDPLLFMEAIPIDETKRYVNRVMTNYWIYRMRLGLSLQSLDAVVAGDWPRYQWSARLADAGPVTTRVPMRNPLESGK